MAAGRIVVPSYSPARDRNGLLVSGARLTVYVNETTTKAAIYANEALTTPLANPVEANSSGRFPAVWAEGGTEASPVLYSVSVTGPDGETIGNPNTFDNWRPSVDAETAQLALIEAAADQAEADAERAEVAADALSGVESLVAVAFANTTVMGTKDQLEDTDIPAVFQSLVTSGYTTKGDRGGGLYVRAASEPAHAGKFQSADGAWWELASLLVTPEMFGAKGDAVLNTSTGAVTATDDTTALQACRDFCILKRRTMWLVSQYLHTGTFQIAAGDTLHMAGQSRRGTGIYLDIDRENEGIHVLGNNCLFENFFVSVMIPLTIQNGQGMYGTCFTVGELFNAYPAREVGETDEEYGLRITPELAYGNTIRSVALLRRPGGGAHAVCATGRMSGLVIEDCDSEGWSESTGRHGSFLLTHWGVSGEDFPRDEDGFLIEPLILQKPVGAFTYHPNNVICRRIRGRHTGRLLNPSSSYNIVVEDFDFDGLDDDVTSNGVQLASLVVGDEADYFAHPDDQGKIYSNIVVRKGTAWNIDGSSPNPAGTSIIDFPAASTSKYINADGTLAEDDKFGSTRYDPPSLANGASTTVDISVPGLVSTDTVSAWYSGGSLGPVASGYDVSGAWLSDGVARVTITNNSGVTRNYPEGTVTAWVQKKRLEQQPLWTGVEFSDIRMFGIGNTESLINIRNGRIQAKFSGIDARGIGCVDGVLIQQCAGSIEFEGCNIPGKTELNVVDGVSFTDCVLDAKEIITVEVASTTGFERADVVTGGTSGIEGTIYEVTNSTVLRVRLSGPSWKPFSVGENLVGPDATSAISAVSAFTNYALLINGETEALTVNGAVSAGDTSITFDSLPNDIRIGDKLTFSGGVTYATRYTDSTETTVLVEPVPVAIADNATVTLDRRSRNIRLSNTSIRGGSRGVDASYCYGVSINGGEIRDAGQYGILVNTGSVLDVNGVTFSNNGVWRASLDTGASTRDIAVQSAATLRVDGAIFKDGARVQYNLVANAGAYGGHVRNCVFVTTGAQGAPITGRFSVPILSNGNVFGWSGNIDNAGDAVFLSGTWTGAVLIGGSATGITISSQTCTYTVFEDRVMTDFDIVLSSKGAGTGNVTISGLPLSQASGTVASIILSAATGLTGAPISTVSSGVISVLQTDADGIANVTNTELTDTTRFRGSLAYRRAT